MNVKTPLDGDPLFERVKAQSPEARAKRLTDIRERLDVLNGYDQLTGQQNTEQKQLIEEGNAIALAHTLDVVTSGHYGTEPGDGAAPLDSGDHFAKASGYGDHPLSVTFDHLAKLQKNIEFAKRGEPELKATVLTTDLGARRAYGSNLLRGPRLLHVVGGAPTQKTDATLAQHPSATLPTATAGVGEGVTLAEYDAINPGSVTLLRFGRFSDLSEEGLLSADARSITQTHLLAVARDLDANLQAKLETDAGAPVAFQADVKAAIRQRIAEVSDNTAAPPTDLVIVANPANVALLEDVVATGGETIAQPFTRFAGAIVYATSAQDTGFMLVANLAVGVRYFEARGVRTEQDWNIKTSVLTLATSVIGGYGTNVITGYVKSQDVVTP